MDDQREIFRHGLAAGGLAMLAGATLLAVLFGVPTDSEAFLVIGLAAVVAVTLLLAGIRDRISVGPITVPWNRLAALPLAAIGAFFTASALASAVEAFSGTVAVWDLLIAPMAVLLVWLAVECWVGGRYMDRETFAVE